MFLFLYFLFHPLSFLLFLYLLIPLQFSSSFSFHPPSLFLCHHSHISLSLFSILPHYPASLFLYFSFSPTHFLSLSLPLSTCPFLFLLHFSLYLSPPLFSPYLIPFILTFFSLSFVVYPLLFFPSSPSFEFHQHFTVNICFLYFLLI